MNHGIAKVRSSVLNNKLPESHCLIRCRMAIPVSPEERIFFFRLCRITLDHIPNVLRSIFKQKVNSKHGYVWSDTTQSGTWLMQNEKWKDKLMATQEQLLLDGDTNEWDSTLVFHTLLYSSLCLLATELKHAQLQPGSRNTMAIGTQTVPQNGKVLIEITGKQKCKMLISNYQLVGTPPTQLQLSSQVNVSAQQSVKVFICESDWYVVNDLRILRNEKYGHVREASISAGDFQKFVTNVEVVYNGLGVQQDEVAKLKSIAAEVIIEKPIVEVIHRCRELWIKEYQENADRITALEADVSDLRSEQHRMAVSVSSNQERIEQLHGGLEEAHSRWEKTSEDVTDLKQKQSEDVGTLSSRTEGCETKLQGALNNIETLQQRQLELRSEQREIAMDVSSNQERTEQIQEELHSKWKKASEDVADLGKQHEELKRKHSEDMETLSSRFEGHDTQLQETHTNMETLQQRQLEQEKQQMDMEKRLSETEAAVKNSATHMVVNQANTVNVINISVPNQAPSVLQSVGFPVGSQPPFPQSGISIVTGSSTNTELLPVQQQYVQPQQTLDANRSRQIPSTVVSRGMPHYHPLPSSVQEQGHESAAPSQLELALPQHNIKPQYEFIEDATSPQTRIKCITKYTIRGQPRRVESDGYYPSKHQAKDDTLKKILDAELKAVVPRGTAITGVKRNKDILEEFSTKMWQKSPRYDTKACKGGYRTIVYVPEISMATGSVCKNKREAEDSAALAALKKLNIVDR